jgi:hypothetical protein
LNLYVMNKSNLKNNKMLNYNARLAIRNLIIAIFVCILIFTCKPVPEELDTRYIPGKEEIESFESSLNKITEILEIAGLSYAIVNDRQIIHTRGMGSNSDKKTATTDENTVYPVGALKNIFISSIILKLYEKNKLDLKQYVSDYNTVNTNIKTARLRHLLSHTAEGEAGSVFNYNQQLFDLLEDVIEEITNKDMPAALKRFITRRSGMKQTAITDNYQDKKNWVSSVSDLAKFSIKLDNNELFKNKETRELMFRPVYLKSGERSPSALGWYIQAYHEKTFAWSFGQGDDYSSLMIKSLSDSLSLIVLSGSENMNTPFQLSKGDLLSSPVASAFLKTFIFRDDTLTGFSIDGQKEKIKSEINGVIKSPHRNLLLNEYLAYLKMYRYMNRKDMYGKLSDCYNGALPLKVPLDLILKGNPYAVIKNVGDYANIKRTFHLNKDTSVTIFAVGEYVKTLEMNPWEYDNTELYFDMKNEKKQSFNVEDDRQLRFDYDYPEITGMFQSVENIEFIQADPTDNSYLFEIKLPWKTLGFIEPLPGTKIGFDITVADNDGTRRHGALVWNSKLNEMPWINTSVYGTLILTDELTPEEKDSVCYSMRIKDLFAIDGHVMNKWSNAPKYEIRNLHLGNISDNNDLSARFCTKWDIENLYFLVEVHDNHKNSIPYSADYGWIENEERDTVWIMKMNETQHAGGAESNKFVNISIPLTQGNYTLYYKSNLQNSMHRWIREAPDICYYGIAVY